MSSFDLNFFPYARSSYQKKSACNISGASNMKKNLYFESFISGGVTALLKEISLKFKLDISPLIFEILENGFQFSTLLIALF